jgi:hypothetical protein
MRTERGCVAETNRAPGQGQDAPRMEKRLEKIGRPAPATEKFDK